MPKPLDLNRSVMGLLRRSLKGFFWALLTGCLFFALWGAYRGWWFLGSGAAFFLVVGIYAAWIEPCWVEVVRYSLRLQDERERRLRIVFLSDFHAGEEKTRHFYKKIFTRVKRLQPDLLLLGGDYVECRATAVEDLADIQEITPRYGAYFVLGNHDYWDDPRYIRHVLEGFGLHDLTGKTQQVGEGEHAFFLSGLDDAWMGTPASSLPLAAVSLPRLLLTHESDILLDLPEASVDLVVLGHTHGGQIRLPRYGAITALPQSTPAWLDRGLRVWRGMRLLISQGVGESSARVRFLARPQIIVIDL